jgi:hypothetical protein
MEAKPTSDQVSAILKECGLDHGYVTEIGAQDIIWRVGLTEGSDCTYGALSKIAERFGTTDLRLRWCDENHWSEDTVDPADAWLEIRM